MDGEFEGDQNMAKAEANEGISAVFLEEDRDTQGRILKSKSRIPCRHKSSPRVLYIRDI